MIRRADQDEGNWDRNGKKTERNRIATSVLPWTRPEVGDFSDHSKILRSAALVELTDTTMAELALFPIEILGVVSQHIDGFDVARLWLSGDYRLIVRLEKGGITHFDLSLVQTVSPKWPQLIARFQRLEFLRIVPRAWHYRIWFSDVDYGSISSTLKHLELRFENLEFSLLGVAFVAVDAHPDPIWSPPTEGSIAVSPFPLDIQFPVLETLILEADEKMRRHRRTGSISRGVALLIAHLPPTLTTLELPHDSIGLALFDQLPPHLTHLSLPHFRGASLEASPRFPSGLRYLSLPSMYHCSHALVAHLPPTLTELDIRAYPTPLSAYIDLLPRNLVKLHLPCREEILMEDCKRFPTSLRHLFPEPALPKGAELSVLPPQITHVTLNAISEAIATSLQRSLAKLSVNGHSYGQSLKMLPEGLQYLNLAYDFPANDSGAPYPFIGTLRKLTVENLDPLALTGAHRLREISTTQVLGRWSSLEYLTSLRILSIYSRTVVADLELVKALPSTLQKLNVASISPDTTRYLPRQLKKLLLHSSTDDCLSDTCISQLPRGLRHLEAGIISERGLALLPRTLELLNFNAEALTDESISALPPNLTECRFWTPNLTDACMPLFPRRLQTLAFSPRVDITKAAAKHLPRNLTSLELGDESDGWTEDCLPDLPPRLLDFSPAPFWEPIDSPSEKALFSLKG